MKKDLMIRPLKESDDMSQLITLSNEFFKEYETHHEFFFKIDSLKDEDIRDYFSSWFDEEDKVALIAICNDRIVAYLTVYIENQADFWEIKQVGHISGLMVEKSMRRQGIAQELFESAMTFLKDKKIKYYTLFASSNNVEAIAFYKRIGMTQLYSHLLGTVEVTIQELKNWK